MVRYLVRGFMKNVSFDSLKRARAYGYGHTRQGTRSYIHAGSDPNDPIIGFVYRYDNIMYWQGKGGNYFLYPDGSVRPLEPPKKKSKAKTNDFGLDWNLK